MSKKIELSNLNFDIEDLMIVALDKDEVVEVNEKVCVILGYSKNELLGKNWFEFIPEANREEIKLLFRQLQNGIFHKGRLEHPVVAKSGESLIISWHITLFKGQSGKLDFALLSGEDVTEHRKIHERHIVLASFPAFDPNSIVEVDFEGKITYANRAAETVFPNIERLGLNQPFFSDWEKVSKLLKGKSAMDYSFGREIKIGKHWFHQQFSYVPINKRIRVYALNIDEKKKAEEELRVSQERYRSLFVNMLDGYAYCKMIFDKQNKPVDFVYLEINDAFERLTGLKRDKVIGKRVTEAIPGIKEANPELFDTYGRVALTGKPERFELFFIPLNIWLNISVYSPEKGYFIALFDNITERKKMEEELNNYNQRLEQVVAQRTAESTEANEKLTREIEERRKIQDGLIFRATILDNIKEAVFLVNFKGDFVYANEAACKMFSYTCDEFLTLNLDQLLQPKDADTLKACMEKIIKEGHLELETVHVRKDKSLIQTQDQYNLIKTLHGKFIVCVLHRINKE